MAQLRRDYQRFVERDIEIIAIGPENAESFRNFWKKNDLPFIGLPDPAHSVLKLYGQEVRLLKLGRMPAQMLIDMSGTLRYVHYGNSMADIAPNEDIFGVIQKIGAGANS
jgi:peroxiredoxin Q/BCP